MNADHYEGRGANGRRSGSGKDQRRKGESRTLFLLENWYLDPTINQSMYEFALSRGICQIDELALKPAQLRLRRRRESAAEETKAWTDDFAQCSKFGQGA
jgi:hypothetical protein